MSKYSNFKNRTQSSADSISKSTASFIENSASSVEVFNNQTQANIKAVIITERKEGADETILFVYKKDALDAGDFIDYDDKTYMVYSEKDIVFSDDFKKYKLIECNVDLKWGENEQKAYFISSLRKYQELNTTTLDIPYAFSGAKPIIITKSNENIKTSTRFLIFNEPFLVKQIDKISNRGIYYITLEPSVYYEEVDSVQDNITNELPEPTVTLETNDLVSGDQETLSTNYAYASFDYDVEILSKSMSSVTFLVPFGIEELTVITKDSDGNFIENNFRIVM